MPLHNLAVKHATRLIFGAETQLRSSRIHTLYLIATDLSTPH